MIKAELNENGSTFPEKWKFDKKQHRTAKGNQAIELMYLINNQIKHKKTGVKSKDSIYSGKVPSAGVEPARFPTGV